MLSFANDFTDFLRLLGVLIVIDLRAAFVLQNALVLQLDQQVHEVVSSSVSSLPLADHLGHDVLEECGDGRIDDLHAQQPVQPRHGRSQHPPEGRLVTRPREPLRCLVKLGFLVGEGVYLYAEGTAANDVDGKLGREFPHLDRAAIIVATRVDEFLQLLATFHQQVEHPFHLARRERGRQFRSEVLPFASFEVEQVAGERILIKMELKFRYRSFLRPRSIRVIVKCSVSTIRRARKATCFSSEKKEK